MAAEIEPVILSKKVRKLLSYGVCRKNWRLGEDLMGADGADELFGIFEEIRDEVTVARAIMGGVLDDWLLVERAAKLLKEEEAYLVEEIGSEVVSPGTERPKGEHEKRVRKLVKQHRRLRKARRRCRDWQRAELDRDRDREAAERLAQKGGEC
jgi:hypothetical protein